MTGPIILHKAPVLSKQEAHQIAQFADKFSPSGLDYQSTFGRQDTPLSRSAVAFNGVGNSVVLTGLTPNDALLTVTFWLKPLVTTNFQRVAFRDSASRIRYGVDNKELVLIPFNNFSTGVTLPDGVLQVGKWVFVAITFDASDGRTEYFVDNVSYGVQLAGATTFQVNVLSANNPLTAAYQQELADYRHHNKILSPLEIQQVGNSEASGSESQWLPLQEQAGNIAYDISGQMNHGTINGDITNLHIQSPDIPTLHRGNRNGYTLKDPDVIVPAVSKTHDAEGNRLTHAGAVRQLVRVKNVNVGQFDGVATVQLFEAPPAGFTFSYDGTSTVNVDAAGLITGTVGNVSNLKIFDGGTLVTQLTFNEGAGSTVYDIIGGNNGTWQNVTDPNQWGKSDDAVDTFLQRGLKNTVIPHVNPISISTQVTVPSFFIDAAVDFTISCWWNGDQTINSSQSICAEGSSVAYITFGRSGSVYTGMNFVGTINNPLARWDATMTGWLHIVLSSSSGIVTQYINGVKQTNQMTLAGTTANYNFLFARGSNFNRANQGYDFRVFDRAISDAEVLALYEPSGVIQPALGDEKRWYKCDEGSGTFIADSGSDALDGTLESDTIWNERKVLTQTNTQGRFIDTGSVLDFQHYNALDSRLPSAYSLGGNITGPLYIQGNDRLQDATPTPEAQSVLDRMNALTDTERNAIIYFVNGLVSFNIWSKIDEFYAFALNNTDWLTAFKDKTALNTNAVRTDKGAEFNGTDAFIDTQFNPASFGVASFNGTSSVVTVTDSPDFKFENGSNDLPFSVSGFMVADDATGFKTLVAKDDVGSNRVWDIYSTDNKIDVFIFTNGSNYIRGTAAVTGKSTGLFFTVTYDGSGLASGIGILFWDFSLNAIEKPTVNFSTVGTYGGMNPNSIPLTIGNNSGANFFDNLLWDVQVHNTVLSDTEIEDVRTGVILGSTISRWRLDGLDFTDSVGSNDGTPTDVTQAFIADPVNQAYQLNDAMVGAYLFSTNWISSLKAIWGCRGDNDGRNRFSISSASSQNAVNSIGAQANTATASDYPDKSLATAVRVDGADVYSYTNGVNTQTSPQPLASGAIPTAQTFYVGARNNQGVDADNYEGTISSFLIGSAIGIDQSILFTLHDQFLKDLGVLDTEAISTEEEDFVVTQDLLAGDDLFRVNNFIKSGFQQLPVRLTAEEEAALEKFKRNEGLYGNWDKIDAIWIFSLISGANALFDIKGFRQATNNSAQKVNNGFKFTGTEWIDLNTAFADLVNASQDDVIISIWIATNDNTVVAKTVLSNGLTSPVELSQDSNVRAKVNSNTYTIDTAFASLQRDTYYSIVREGTSQDIYVNGVLQKGATIASVSLESGNLLVGKKSGDTEFYEGIVSAISIGQKT